jgi:hypothetical protein
MIIFLLKNILLAIAPSSLRTLPLLILIATIALLYASAVSIIVDYIQSIGSGIGTSSGLLNSFFSLQYCTVEGTITTQSMEELHACLMFSSMLPLKAKRLTKNEKAEFVLTEEHKNILIGLLLGDVFAEKRSPNGNTRIRFDQSTKHEAYLFHLYDLFKSFCASAPITINRPAALKTGLIYSSNYFTTFSLPCFNELHNLFYPKGKKIVPDPYTLP